MLTQQNLSQWLQSLDSRSLPKTFRDAIRIAQKLQIPYLWIDCMCIIQNDDKDWQQEAASMADIYRNAYLTFAAASSSDSNGGCFIDPPMPPFIRKFSLGAESTNSEREIIIRPNFHQKSTVASSCLHTRGWIFQEQILSRRTVYFTDNQMLWQCHDRQYSEDALGDGPKLCLQPARLAQYNLGEGEGSSTRTPDEVWWTWMSDYSTRKFTYFKDRLAALAGVTTLYQEKTGDIPLVGLWLQNLPLNLLWRCEPRSPNRESSKNPGINGLPSWSWVGFDGVVLPPESMRRSQRQRREDFPLHLNVKSQSHNLQWTGAAITSTLKIASINLYGPFMEMKDHLELVPPQAEPGCRLDHHWSLPRRYPRKLYNHSSLACYEEVDEFDSRCQLTTKHGDSEISFDYDVSMPVCIFGLLIYLDPSTDTEHILLLSPVDNSSKCFRRLGIAKHKHSCLLRFEPGESGESDESDDIDGDDTAHIAMSCFQQAEFATVELV